MFITRTITHVVAHRRIHCLALQKPFNNTLSAGQAVYFITTPVFMAALCNSAGHYIYSAKKLKLRRVL